MSNPPICNVEGVVKLPDQKMNPFQPIPKAVDLPSVIRAVQAITNNFYTLAKAGDYAELKQFRTFKTVRVFNPDDQSQWVDVQQITGLVFQDPVTGRFLTWRQ